MNSRQVSKAAAMNSSISLIPVDVIHEFELLKDDGVFGVYRKVYRDDTCRVSYMIARQPSLKTPAESPASVLKEYEDETGVSLAFEHWSQFVLPPRLARKRQTRSPYKPESAESIRCSEREFEWRQSLRAGYERMRLYRIGACVFMCRVHPRWHRRGRLVVLENGRALLLKMESRSS